MPVRYSELLVLGLALGMAVAVPGGAGEWRLSGSLAADLRLFAEDPSFPGQEEDSTQPSITFQPEWRFTSEEGHHKFSFIPFLRLDGVDDERSHFDLREAYWLYIADSWELTLGIDKVFWGVTESLHLVDVINQTDLVEEVDGEDKLGQPMLRLSTLRPWGTLSFFAMPAFRERTFAGPDGRLRAPLAVDTDRPQYASGAEEGHLDLALRYAHYLGNWDLGAYYFRGTGREPRLLPRADGQALLPFYTIIQQVGIDLQYTHDAWLWKLEAIGREGQGKTFGAMVAGLEYTFYQLVGGSSDLGVLVELLYDDRDVAAPVTFFDDDIFIGARWARNDIRDTTLLAGVVIDRHGGGTALFAEGETRIADGWTIELEARVFSGVEADDPLFAVQNDDFLTLRLAWFF
jgi:hypothetical protein